MDIAGVQILLATDAFYLHFTKAHVYKYHKWKKIYFYVIVSSLKMKFNVTKGQQWLQIPPSHLQA